MRLVALLEPTQDRDGVLDRRFADVDLLEPPLQGGVLLDVLAVLVEGGRADEPQLAPGQHRLEHVAGVHRALAGRTGPDDGVQLVDEGDDPSLGPGDLLEDGLEPLLELAAVLRAGHHRAEVERDQRLAAQALRDVARDDALGEPLDDGGLADSGVTDEDGVVLGPPRQHLHDPADLGVAADDRIQPALAGGGGQVGAVLLQGLEGRLRLLGVDATPTAQLRDGRLDRGGVEAEVPGAREREQQVVGRDERVAHRRHQRARALQHGERTAGQLRRGERRAGHRRQRREDPVGCGDGPGDGRPGGLEQRRGGRVGLLGQGLQDVRGLDVGMSVRGGRARGGRQGLVGLGRQLQIHGVRVPLSAGMRVCRFTEDNVGQS